MQNTHETNRGKPDSLNHPGRDEWMAYLYGELPRPAKSALSAHLESCSSCQQQVAGWHRAMQSLDTWELPRRRRAPTVAVPFLKWGVAALFMLGLGYGMGRFAAPASETPALRAGLERSLRESLEKQVREQIRADLTSEFQAMFASARHQLGNDLNTMADQTLATANLQAQRLLAVYDEKWQEDNQTLLARLNNLDSRQTSLAAAMTGLRRDAETMAVLTENSFRRTQQQMYRLASFTSTDPSFPESPEKK